MDKTPETRKKPPCQLEDQIKRAYQSSFGPGHLIEDDAKAQAWIDREWQEADLQHPLRIENIGGGWSRIHFGHTEDDAAARRLILRLFCLSAVTARSQPVRFHGLLDTLAATSSQAEKQIARYRARGCPPLHHSDVYRESRHPHYRVVRQDLAQYFWLLLKIQRLLENKPRALIGLDGRIASGKSSLAARIAEVFGAHIIHTDDYYTPRVSRSAGWQKKAAGNMDLSRLREEVLIPYQNGQPLHTAPFDCQSQQAGKPVDYPADRPLIVEGSYALEDSLRSYYDASFYLELDPQVQRERVAKRNGDYAPVFYSTWIPLEQVYIDLQHPEAFADVVLNTTTYF